MPWFPISEVRELLRPATSTRRRLPAEPERSGELHRSDLVRCGGAEDVAAGAAAPGDRPVAGRKTATGQSLDDAPARCLDAQRDARGTRALEGRFHARGARGGGDEGERGV